MHTTAIGSGVAIARLRSRPDLASSAARFVELARCKLVVSGTTLILAMVFAQPLILTWHDSWKLAYLVGLSLAIKFTTDGFYLTDILTHVTNEFTLAVLKKAERDALNIASLSRVEQRYHVFRNALISAAFDRMSLFTGNLTQMAAYENKVLGDEEPIVNILIVHDEREATALARLVADIEHTAVIVTLTRCGDSDSICPDRATSTSH